MFRFLQVANKISEADAADLFPKPYQLKAYQLVGLNWMWMLHNLNSSGVLADEMGLGKTVQAIALLTYLHKRCGNSGPHLVLAPPSTLANWERELQHWCPDLRVLVYGGSARDRSMFHGTKLSKFADVVLSGYTYFERDSCKEDRRFFKKQDWQYLIADEAHGVKSQSTNRYARLMEVKSKYRVLLTGTPVQNNVGELFTMLRFAMPNIFVEDDVELFADPELAEESRLEPIRQMLLPFVLRRIKRDILGELPPKVEKVDKLALSPAQVQVYKHVIGTAKCTDTASKHMAAIEVTLAPPDAAGSGALVELDVDTDDDGPAPAVASPSGPSGAGSSDGAVVGSGVDSSVSDDDEVKVVTPASVKVTVPPRMVNHLFSELRKACNHPLLCSSIFNAKPEAIVDIARMLRSSGHFGPSCTLDQVVKELTITSDFNVHL